MDVAIVRLPVVYTVSKIILVSTGEHLSHDPVGIQKCVMSHDCHLANDTLSEPAVKIVIFSSPDVVVLYVRPAPAVIV